MLQATSFDMRQFHFHSGQGILFSLETSSLTHGLISVLFSFQVFEDFPIVCFFISSVIPLWSDNILCMILILLYLLGFFFMTWDIVYLGEYYMCT